MTDYKHTLNLPKTDFPMKANLSQREPAILKKWEELNLYQKLRDLGKTREKFIFHDGPPYANGHIHMGTAVNKILKDMAVKSKTLSGFDSAFIPGWDCHGLPIELNVEKKLGKPGVKVSQKEFRKACRDYAASQIDIQKAEFKRLGLQADWENPYLTMDPLFEANVVRALAKIIKNGHVQKGYRPVHWCLDCASSLAEAEVEYMDKTSSAIDVRFTSVDDPKLSIPIWTTTPWTLPANQAVALNPFIEYAEVETNNERFIIAEPLVVSAMQRYQITDYKIIRKMLGETLEGMQLQHPFYNKTVPVILGEHVTVDSGTGAVHTAPAHGQDDFVVGKKYNLPMENPVGDDGCFISTVEFLAGSHVNKANDIILKILEEKNKLIHLAKISHSYPHCWRHKTPLIFRATPQWFISMDQKQLRTKALEDIQKVKWVPDWGQNRIYTMVEKRPDWCISRQRTWGVPIALFIHKETGELHPDTLNLMEMAAKKIEKEGIEGWFSLDEKEFLKDDAAHYKKVTDILDVWFDSGVTHECVLRQRPELGFPADLYLEGSDQHRGWFQSSLLTSVAISNEAPFKTVLTHGYVVDGQGRKMSKSLGNVIAPEKIIQSWGADILRLWVSSIDYRYEINVSDEILTRTSETYRRIRNTARFLLANLDGFDPEKHLVPKDQMLALDKWVVDKARLIQQEIIENYNEFQFHAIYQKIQYFCSIELSSFYLDIIKDRQYTTQTNSIARRSAQTAMYHIIEAFVRWIAPILSFTAEEIWQYIPGKRNESVFLNTWYDQLFELPKTEKMDQPFWEKLRHIRDVVNKEIEKQRADGLLGSSLEASVHLYCAPELKNELDELGDELRFALITSSAAVHDISSAESDVIHTEFPGLALKVESITYLKCERCWHRMEDVGQHSEHATLCLRCILNIERNGEERKYA